MSATAPAGSASSITGRLSAASTSATIEGDEESEVISHPAPTSCIQLPMFDTMVAIHNPRKSPWRSGLQGDCAVMAATLYACVSDDTVQPGWPAPQAADVSTDTARRISDTPGQYDTVKLGWLSPLIHFKEFNHEALHPRSAAVLALASASAYSQT